MDSLECGFGIGFDPYQQILGRSCDDRLCFGAGVSCIHDFGCGDRRFEDRKFAVHAVERCYAGTDFSDESVWFEEFLDFKIVLGSVNSSEEAIEKINKYGGGHSAVIMTQNDEAAQKFMESVDSAAVYQNASTRFTDGGQFGLGGELAISTDKLHQRGPIGLQHLVTNKWYIYGDGQIR